MARRPSTVSRGTTARAKRTTQTNGTAPRRSSAAVRSAGGDRSTSTRPTADHPATEPATFSIGELARRTKVSPRTIRFYEELGILPTPSRSTGGTRRYPRDYVFYVEGARMLKELGFSLEEIAELGHYALKGTAASQGTQRLLKGKLAELEHRMRVLNRLHDLVTEAAEGRRPKSGDQPLLQRWLSEEPGTARSAG